MTTPRFTLENTIGFSRQELDILNAIYEERISLFEFIGDDDQKNVLESNAARIILEEFEV